MVDCPFQYSKRYCQIPTELGKSDEDWDCDWRNNESNCPIMKFVEGYAEDYHSDMCSDCEFNCEEDTMREAMNDAYD